MTVQFELTDSLESRFWNRLDKGGNCWNWQGGKDRPDGYGCLHYADNGKRHSLKAHRVSWVIHNGPIPDGLWVLHKCDNPSCVNPNHLFLGTRQDNMLDAASKGRISTIGKSRQTHCIRGHKFTEQNTRVTKEGHRRCRACQRLYDNGRAR